MDIIPVDEVRRKSFHLLSLVYILAYWVLPRLVMLWGLGIVIAFVLLGEALRLRFPHFNKWLLALLGGVHRNEETYRISGLPWTLLGSFFTILLFPNKKIVLISFLYLAFGDASAALIGRWIGRHKIIKDKSLEGSLACFIACFVIGIFFMPWPFAVLCSLLATVIEAVPWPLNDNFWMPLASASALTFLIPLLKLAL